MAKNNYKKLDKSSEDTGKSSYLRSRSMAYGVQNPMIMDTQSSYVVQNAPRMGGGFGVQNPMITGTQSGYVVQNAPRMGGGFGVQNPMITGTQSGYVVQNAPRMGGGFGVQNPIPMDMQSGYAMKNSTPMGMIDVPSGNMYGGSYGQRNDNASSHHINQSHYTSSPSKTVSAPKTISEKRKTDESDSILNSIIKNIKNTNYTDILAGIFDVDEFLNDKSAGVHGHASVSVSKQSGKKANLYLDDNDEDDDDFYSKKQSKYKQKKKNFRYDDDDDDDDDF